MQLPDEKHRLEFPGLSGVYGYVTVDGQPLEVYGVEKKDGKVVAYIEAKEGKRFKPTLADVRSRARASADYVVDVVLDGELVTGYAQTIEAAMYDHSGFSPDRVHVFKGKETATSHIPFLFQPLQVTADDDDACTDENIIRGLGSLRLKYHRVTDFHDSSSLNDFAKSKPSTSKLIHESSKKATLSHQAGFGEPEAKEGMENVDFDFLDPEDSPLAQLEFRYRSRVLLQLEGHIPASPEPSPSPKRSPSPVQPASASPASRPSASPVAGPSNPRHPSSSTAAADAGPAASSGSPSSADLSRLSQLEAELAEPQREKRIAALQREIDQLRGGASPSSSTSTSTAAKRIKPEPGTLSESERKRVKREEVDEVEREKEENKRRGKKAEVIDLCDSD
ncbi:hypothetical protein JCM8097_005846 [Rhodosporidiobolus ruineniae]